ncbi:alanine racemase [Vibrio hepatarius]|uniref:alanine racemase n=1 Tax=Vibrio hepatarius TaxID=171383 RepID=UPI00142DB411|nr:alanine racemase [Vibrio hepatarius]NIY83047.1 amino acid deaminase [Vibrio hepatarius]
MYQEKHLSQQFLSANRGTRLPLGSKGAPLCRSSQGAFSLKDEEVSLPCAVVRRSAIESNIDWMQTFAKQHNVELCPHGKTTMTPELFAKQLEAGAWGLTVATPAQAEIAVMAGAQRIIIANQVVGIVNMQMVINLIQQHGVNIFICVDSVANVKAWQAQAKEFGVTVPLFIELGVKGGRCGCRTEEQVKQLAQLIMASDALELHGIEVYEGVISGEHAEQNIRQFLCFAVSILLELKQIYALAQPIISGAGSAWYDVVAEEFSQLQNITAVIRPGCYAVHDTGIYQMAQDKVQKRARINGGIACDLAGDLVSSLEIWAYVISVPEPSKAVVGLGKRDVAFDAGLPKIERVIRDGKEIAIKGLVASNVMDQHLFVDMPQEVLQVGDILVMSTSHPCLTFDKWRFVGVINQDDVITHWMETYF